MFDLFFEKSNSSEIPIPLQQNQTFSIFAGAVALPGLSPTKPKAEGEGSHEPWLGQKSTTRGKHQNQGIKLQQGGMKYICHVLVMMNFSRFSMNASIMLPGGSKNFVYMTVIHFKTQGRYGWTVLHIQ